MLLEIIVLFWYFRCIGVSFTFSRAVPTYETASTRQFFNARTETLRTCSSESVAFCRAALDPSKSVNNKHSNSNWPSFTRMKCGAIYDNLSCALDNCRVVTFSVIFIAFACNLRAITNLFVLWYHITCVWQLLLHRRLVRRYTNQIRIKRAAHV